MQQLAATNRRLQVHEGFAYVRFSMEDLENCRDYLHGYMVPSTGYLKTFALASYSNGFILRYPRSSHPDELQPLVDYPKLVNVFDEYGDWMTKLGVKDVGALNEVIVSGHKLVETILVAEALHEQRIAQIATRFLSNRFGSPASH